MAFKKTTIILFPGGSDKVRQFRLPQYLLISLILLFVSYTASFTYFLCDYIIIKTRMPLLTQLKKENKKQKMQFIYLAEQINQMNQKVGELQDIDRRISFGVNLKTGSENKQLQGIGGSDQDLIKPDISIVKKATRH